MKILKSNRLTVRVMDPEYAARLTSRFDPTCFITEVVLDKSVYFCASEPHNMPVPSSGGRGLCSEFSFDVFSEAEIGEWVPKLGVGLLKKEDNEGFVFYKKYEKQPFIYEMTDLYAGGISFKTLPRECLGYAVETSRTLKVEENILLMTVSLKNVGTKDITFREYCHNFLSIDGMALGPDYRLELPNGRAVVPKGYNPGGEIYDFDMADLGRDIPFRWRLSHKGVRASVTGAEYFRPAAVCVWTCDHMVCPEVHFEAMVKPGEEIFWKRQWIFRQEGIK